MPGDIHFEVDEVMPEELVTGDWVLFLPLGLAEEVYDNPPMAQVSKIEFGHGDWTILTDKGAMFRKPGETVQRIG